MNTHRNDPLSPEERQLAQLMARLGPSGEPSPSLDARILAAAHSAATREPTRSRKPRWPVAMGLAASVVFAVGIAWQLRPVQQIATMQEAPVAEPAREVAPADAAAPAAAAPVAAEAVAQAANSDTAATSQVAAPAPPPSTPAMAPAPAARKSMPPLPPKPAATQRRDARNPSGYVASPPPPPAPPAAAVEAQPVAAPEPQAFARDHDTDAMAGAAATAESAARSARDGDARQSAARVEMKAANAAAAREEESTTLDHIEVTGTRLRTDRQVPISDDARLAVDDWLERVRTRYGLGDAEAARRSLLLFVKDHPDETIPEDLEPLLDE